MNRLSVLGRSLINRLRSFRWLGQTPSNFDPVERRLIIQSVVIGAAVWGPVFLLKLLVQSTFAGLMGWMDKAPSSFLILLPLWVGAAIVVLLAGYRGRKIIHYESDGHVHELPDVEGDGLERAIALYHASEPSFEHALLGKEGIDVRWELPTFSLAGRKFLATWATLGSGGSGGLEGSVSLIGESIAAAMFKPRAPISRAKQRFPWLSHPVRWWSAQDVDHLQTAQLGGIAAAVATLTGAPFMSAFFAAEVMYRRRPLIEKLIYSLISTLVAYFLNSIFSSGHKTLFQVAHLYLPPGNWQYYGLVGIVSVLIAIISIMFARLRRIIESSFNRYSPNVWTKHLLGATLTALVAITVVALSVRYEPGGRASALELVLGTGNNPIELALAGELTLLAAALALAGKSLTTLLTIGSGGSAGLLIPAIYLGTMAAVLVAIPARYEPMLLIVPAMTASLVSLVNVPLAAILLPVELFSSHYLPAALLALLIGALLTQNDKIYRTQRETFAQRQILPGVEVRRVEVPLEWDRKTLIDLDLRRRFNITVIGMIDTRRPDGSPHVRLNPAATLRLSQGDTIVVLGEESNLLDLENSIREDELNHSNAGYHRPQNPRSQNPRPGIDDGKSISNPTDHAGGGGEAE